MKKRNSAIIISAIIIGVGIIVFTMYLIDMERMKHNYDVVFSTWGYNYAPPEHNYDKNNEAIISNVVEIKDGNINDETIIEKFIEEANSDTIDEKTLIIREYYSETEYNQNLLKFIPYIEKCKEEENENTVQVNIDELKKQQGAFSFKTGDFQHNITLEFNAFDYNLKRKVEDGVVIFYLKANSSLINTPEEQEICKYSLESSNYKKDINLNFYQRKDLGINTINKYGESDFNIYTYGGDVSFTVDTDMLYTFETALEEKVVTVESILNQAKMDSEYGICKEGYYSDGGSVEYLYDDYTILKFNTLDGRKDLVIGIKGQIINDVEDLFEEI